MFNLGITEIVVILVVALVVFGPKRLPEIARAMGKSMGELRKALDEVKHEVGRLDSEPPQTPSERRLKSGAAAGSSPTPSDDAAAATTASVATTYPQSFLNQAEVAEGDASRTAGIARENQQSESDDIAAQQRPTKPASQQ